MTELIEALEASYKQLWEEAMKVKQELDTAKQNKLKTNDEYLADPDSCPVCNWHVTEGYKLKRSSSSNEEVLEEVSCVGCNSKWYRFYKLDRYSLISKGTTQ